MRTLYRWNRRSASTPPATIMVPALYNFMPAESVALGWLNEIESLVTIRQRMACAARITGWDVFTFHTLHNADHYFDTTIGAVRDTWMKEGNLSTTAIMEAKRQFGRACDYHRIHARLVENLVFQSSLIDWLAHQAAGMPVGWHVVGTALLSALVSAGSISFTAAVESAVKMGTRWDQTVRGSANTQNEEEIAWSAFRQVWRLMEGNSNISMGVTAEDLPSPKAPVQPFWFSATMGSEPVLITTAQEAADALQTLNLASWAYATPKLVSGNSIQGWLVSPLHPMARQCRWSVSNYLLATPAAATLFLEQVTTFGCDLTASMTDEAAQNRLRLSRIKVTGP